MLFEADVVARQTALPSGPPEVDGIAVCANAVCRVGRRGGMCCRSSPVASLARGAVETVKTVIFKKALVERLSLPRIARVHLLKGFPQRGGMRASRGRRHYGGDT